VSMMGVARGPLLALALCWSVMVGAQLPVPPLVGRVTDQTATLSETQISTLDQTLREFETRKGSQLAVLVVASTAPDTIEQYALRVAEQWKLGRQKVDDGAILVVAKDDRALRLEVGYGLEGALNDATSRRIIDEIITPPFSKGDFYGGISAGVGQIIRVIDGEPLPAPAQHAGANLNGFVGFIPIILMLALVLGSLLHGVLGRFLSALITGGAVGVMTWFFAGAVSIALGAGLMGLVISLIGGTTGQRGAFGIGGVGGIGGSGRDGGFGGGGGGFGGGGASGRW